MFYKDNEIMARIYQSTSDLYSLKDDGTLDESMDMVIFNDDKSVVWYEVSGMEHIKTPFDSKKTFGFDTIEDAKKAIDWDIKRSEGEE